MARRADYRDDDGEWWAVPLELGLSAWWWRMWPDGSIQARHRDRPCTRTRPDGIKDVTVPAGADEPGRLLQAMCGSAVFAATSLGRPASKV